MDTVNLRSVILHRLRIALKSTLFGVVAAGPVWATDIFVGQRPSGSPLVIPAQYDGEPRLSDPVPLPVTTAPATNAPPAATPERAAPATGLPNSLSSATSPAGSASWMKDPRWVQHPSSTLFVAIAAGNPVDVDLAIERGADPNALGPSAMTPLAWAYSHRRPEVVPVLSRRGADCSQMLLFPAYSPESEMFAAFAGCGADPAARDERGNTVFHIFARQATTQNRWSLDSARKRVSAMIAANADPLAVDRLGRNPLKLAITLGNFMAATALVESGAYPIETLFPISESVSSLKASSPTSAELEALKGALTRSLVD